MKLTLIVDKMDSAKNHIPWFSNGRKPKDVEELLKKSLELHVTGVIIHGQPDARYIFWSLPHLPGNANLNLECIRLALVRHLSALTFRPKLYCQFDNASDNKCYATLCLAAWLVLQGYISQVCCCATQCRCNITIDASRQFSTHHLLPTHALPYRCEQWCLCVLAG